MLIFYSLFFLEKIRGNHYEVIWILSIYSWKDINFLTTTCHGYPLTPFPCDEMFFSAWHLLYSTGVRLRDSEKYPVSKFSIFPLAIYGLILSKLTGTFSTPCCEHGLREMYLFEIKNPSYKSPVLNECSQFFHNNISLFLITWSREGGSIF